MCHHVVYVSYFPSNTEVTYYSGVTSHSLLSTGSIISISKLVMLLIFLLCFYLCHFFVTWGQQRCYSYMVNVKQHEIFIGTNVLTVEKLTIFSRLITWWWRWFDDWNTVNKSSMLSVQRALPHPLRSRCASSLGPSATVLLWNLAASRWNLFGHEPVKRGCSVLLLSFEGIFWFFFNALWWQTQTCLLYFYYIKRCFFYKKYFKKSTIYKVSILCLPCLHICGKQNITNTPDIGLQHQLILTEGSKFSSILFHNVQYTNT